MIGLQTAEARAAAFHGGDADEQVLALARHAAVRAEAPLLAPESWGAAAQDGQPAAAPPLAGLSPAPFPASHGGAQ
jgi:hypothetical protein